jgi:hypothetical protein
MSDNNQSSQTMPEPEHWQKIHVLMAVMEFRPLTDIERKEMHEALVSIRESSSPAASVSERARELLAGAYRVHGHFEYADILLNKPLVGEDYIAAYAIEQALAQQQRKP